MKLKSDSRKLVSELVDTSMGPQGLGMDNQGGAWWALDALESLEALEREGWRFIPPPKEDR